MKNSSVAILVALGVAGAAGVYLATQDASEEEVSDVSTQSTDGSGGSSQTKGERCDDLSNARRTLMNRITELQSERKALLEQDGVRLADEYARELSRRSDGRGTGDSRRAQAASYLATGGGWHSGDEKRLTSKTWPKLKALREKIVALTDEEKDKEEKLSVIENEMDSYAAEGVTACIY